MDYINQQFKSDILNQVYSLDSTSKVLDLPIINHFIPDTLDLVENEEGLKCDGENKYLLRQTELSELFYKKDQKFNIPKGSIYIKIFSDFTHIASDSDV